MNELLFLECLTILFDSTAFIVISIGLMVALVGWGVGKVIQALGETPT